MAEAPPPAPPVGAPQSHGPTAFEWETLNAYSKLLKKEVAILNDDKVQLMEERARLRVELHNFRTRGNTVHPSSFSASEEEEELSSNVTHLVERVAKDLIRFPSPQGLQLRIDGCSSSEADDFPSPGAIEENDGDPDFKEILSTHLNKINFKSLDRIIMDARLLPFGCLKILSFVILSLRMMLNVTIVFYNFISEHDQRDASERFNLSQLILYYTEFLTVSLMIVAGLTAIVYGMCVRDSRGYAAYILSRVMKSLSSFSLLQFIPSTSKAVIIFYRAHDFLQMVPTSMKTKVRVVFAVGAVPLAIVYSALGLASFVVKLSQVNFVATEDFDVWARDIVRVFTIGAFLNNVMSLTDIWAVRYDSILTFIFAGKDGMLDLTEYLALQTFKQELCNQLLDAHGILVGFMLITQIYDGDIQSLVIHEDEVETPHDHAMMAERKAVELFKRKKSFHKSSRVA